MSSVSSNRSSSFDEDESPGPLTEQALNLHERSYKLLQHKNELKNMFEDLMKSIDERGENDFKERS